MACLVVRRGLLLSRSKHPMYLGLRGWLDLVMPEPSQSIHIAMRLHGGRQAARSGRSCGQDGQRDGRQTSGIDRNDLDLRRTGGQRVTLTERGVNGDRDRKIITRKCKIVMRKVTCYSNCYHICPPYTLFAASEYAAPVHSKERRYTNGRL